MKQPLTNDEVLLISIYGHADRKTLTHALEELLPLTESDSAMYPIMKSCIEKLSAFSDAEYDALDIPDYPSDEEDAYEQDRL